VSKKETAQVLAAEIVSFAIRFLEDHQERTLGELVHLQPEARRKVAVFAADRLIVLLERRLPSFVQSFDIQKLVEDKINDLDVASVERLLLMVIARHLKWINLFGALLGALIGLSQVVLNLIRING
jgi:uncharacterized membrane protein YheB (UPF0754 family)